MPNPFAAYTGDTSPFFGEYPEAGYFSYQNQWKTPNQKKFFQSQFSNILNQYMGQLGRLVNQGQKPTLQLTDFLQQFDWGRNFQQEGPQQDTSRLNPFTRWVLP